MHQFTGPQSWIRKHFEIYLLLRKLAPFFCRFLNLEEGFSALKFIEPMNNSYQVLDIGANDGTSLRMIRRYFPKTPLVAFDPVCRPTFDISDIDFYDVALADFSGSAEIHVPWVVDKRLTQYSSLSSASAKGQIVHDFGVGDSKINIESKTVKVTTLDSLSLRPFFVKIDVEGSELSVLRGAKKTLSEFKPLILIEIQNQEIFNSVANYLSEFGYKCISLDLMANLKNTFFTKDFESRYNSKSNNFVWVSYPNTSTWKFKD